MKHAQDYRLGIGLQIHNLAARDKITDWVKLQHENYKWQQHIKS